MNRRTMLKSLVAGAVTASVLPVTLLTASAGPGGLILVLGPPESNKDQWAKLLYRQSTCQIKSLIADSSLSGPGYFPAPDRLLVMTESLSKPVEKLTVQEAQKQQVCRICKLRDQAWRHNPLILKFGKEYAHRDCIRQTNRDVVEDAEMVWAAVQRAEMVVLVDVAGLALVIKNNWGPIGLLETEESGTLTASLSTSTWCTDRQ